MMIYGCVFCNRIWCSQEMYETLDKENLDLENREDISHGICPECFQKQKHGLVHNHQKKNGYDECYNRNDGCTNNFCMFKPTCGTHAIEDWKNNIILLSTGNWPCMITSKEIISISEEYLKSILIDGNQVDIYKNPTSSDVTKINKSFNTVNANKSVRFIADAKNQVVYVWDAYFSTHDIVLSKLGLGTYNTYFSKQPQYIMGGGNVSGGKIVIGGFLQTELDSTVSLLKSHFYSPKDQDIMLSAMEKRLSFNWSFVDQYVSGVSNIIKDVKNKLDSWTKNK